MQNALRLDPFCMDQNTFSDYSTLGSIDPKMKLRTLPPLTTTLSCTSTPFLNDASEILEPPLSFESVATAICSYRIALLNFQSSSPEEKDTNGKALDNAVKAVQQVFDLYDGLSECSRQLVGVFLKELHYESTKERTRAEMSDALENGTASFNTPSASVQETQNGA